VLSVLNFRSLLLMVFFFSACRNVLSGLVSNLAEYRVLPCSLRIDSSNFNHPAAVLSLKYDVRRGRRVTRSRKSWNSSGFGAWE
jgi:hypothetical protein